MFDDFECFHSSSCVDCPMFWGRAKIKVGDRVQVVGLSGSINGNRGEVRSTFPYSHLSGVERKGLCCFVEGVGSRGGGVWLLEDQLKVIEKV